MLLDNHYMPRSVVSLFGNEPIMHESGFLYFRVDPNVVNVHDGGKRPVWLKIRSRCTERAVRFWLHKIASWDGVFEVTVVGRNK